MNTPFLFNTEGPIFYDDEGEGEARRKRRGAPRQYERSPGQSFPRRANTYGSRYARPGNRRYSRPYAAIGRYPAYSKLNVIPVTSPPRRRPRRPQLSYGGGGGIFPTTSETGSECIRLVQRLLNKFLGLNLPVDGVMNVDTRSAIRSFEGREGPSGNDFASGGQVPAPFGDPPDQPDGDLDKAQEEFEMMFGLYENKGYFELEDEVNRQSSEYSIWIQQSLNKVAGLRLAVDGVIGPKTRNAIRLFQRQQGLPADGVVGPKTELAFLRAGAVLPPQGSIAPLPTYIPGPGGDDRTPSGSPVIGGRITSPFGVRKHPKTDLISHHNGVDIGRLPVGTTVSATAAGTVIFAAMAGYAGNMVRVNHGNGYETLYMHLNRITVRKGETVTRGQKVGELGQTGRVTGPHLHYEIRKNGKPADPGLTIV